LRLIAASLVIISHAYGLSHPVGYYDEDKIFNSQGIGWAAVNIFFIMSGYLIGKSVFKNPNVWRFCKNRALRIYPGLIFCTLVSVIFLGIVFRSGDFIHYAASVETLKFTLGNSTAILIQFFLPGVFVHNVYPGAVNGSLWSLPFELGCYAIVGGLLATGILRSPKTRLAAFLALLVFYVGGSVLIATGHFPHSSTLNKLHRLTICFGLGMFYAEFRPISHTVLACRRSAGPVCSVKLDARVDLARGNGNVGLGPLGFLDRFSSSAVSRSNPRVAGLVLRRLHLRLSHPAAPQSFLA
jgi:peptidoglycan/LPS O-acetylase OafA/YrhL